MMLVPSYDGFLTSLQAEGKAHATITASDDLAVSIDAIRAAARDVGIADVRVFLGADSRSLTVLARETAGRRGGRPMSWDSPPPMRVQLRDCVQERDRLGAEVERLRQDNAILREALRILAEALNELPGAVEALGRIDRERSE